MPQKLHFQTAERGEKTSTLRDYQVLWRKSGMRVWPGGLPRTGVDKEELSEELAKPRAEDRAVGWQEGLKAGGALARLRYQVYPGGQIQKVAGRQQQGYGM